MSWYDLIATALVVALLARGVYQLGFQHGTAVGYVKGSQEVLDPFFEQLTDGVELTDDELAQIIREQERKNRGE